MKTYLLLATAAVSFIMFADFVATHPQLNSLLIGLFLIVTGLGVAGYVLSQPGERRKGGRK